MRILLEAVAAENTLHVGRLSQAYEAESRAIRTTPSPLHRALKAADAARLICPSTVNELDAWVTGVESALHKGMNKDDFRGLVHRDREFLTACRTICTAVVNDFQQAASMEESQELIEARTAIADAMARLTQLDDKILGWQKIAERQPPEIDPALVECGAEQIRQGKFKTPDQAIEMTRTLPR